MKNIASITLAKDEEDPWAAVKILVEAGATTDALRSASFSVQYTTHAVVIKESTTRQIRPETGRGRSTVAKANAYQSLVLRTAWPPVRWPISCARTPWIIQGDSDREPGFTVMTPCASTHARTSPGMNLNSMTGTGTPIKREMRARLRLAIRIRLVSMARCTLRRG